jgi:hypothetical protein
MTDENQQAGEPTPAAADVAEVAEASRPTIYVDITDDNNVTLVYEAGDRHLECEFNPDNESATDIAIRLETFAKNVREREEWARHNPPAQTVRNADVTEAVAERTKTVEAASDDEIERELAERRNPKEARIQRERELAEGYVGQPGVPGVASDPIQPGPTTENGPGSRPT